MSALLVSPNWPCPSGMPSMSFQKTFTNVAFCLAILLLLPGSARAQQSFSLGSAVMREISGSETHSHTFTADAGDLVAGPVDLVGPEAAVAFLDGAGNPVAGMRIRGFYLSGTVGRRVGFVAPASGSYQVRIAAAGTRRGNYTLRLDRVAIAERMRGV